MRRLISVFVEDILITSNANLASLRARHPDDIRNHETTVICFSPNMAADLDTLRGYLFKNMWRHYKVNRMTSKAKQLVTDLLHCLCPNQILYQVIGSFMESRL